MRIVTTSTTQREIKMIKNSKQNWQVGQTVKVGFMSLVVKGARETPGDYAPDAYLLTNAAGTKFYEFVPHNGLSSLSAWELENTWKIAA